MSFEKLKYIEFYDHLIISYQTEASFTESPHLKQPSRLDLQITFGHSSLIECETLLSYGKKVYLMQNIYCSNSLTLIKNWNCLLNA